MSMDRRGFIKGAAVSAAIMAGASMAACSASEATPSASAQEEPTWDYETDVAIVGSGMGRASRPRSSAIENGASAIVVEISKQTGGGSAFSGGMVHMTAAGGSKEMFDTWTDRLAQDDLSLAYFEGYQETCRLA